MLKQFGFHQNLNTPLKYNFNGRCSNIVIKSEKKLFEVILKYAISFLKNVMVLVFTLLICLVDKSF